MPYPIASKTRQAIRQAIGYILGTILVSEASAAGTTTTLIDTQGLAFGGTDDYKGGEVIMISGTSANVGSTARVTAFNATSKQLTLSPALPSATADGDGYEYHEGYFIDEINNAINLSIVAATDDILIETEDHTLVREKDKYEYQVPSALVAIHTVEWVYSTKIDDKLHDCDAVWDELVGTGVTASLDTSFYKEGSGSLKLVVAAGAAAGILATEDITALDISDCDEVTAWFYSTVAHAAGGLQILLAPDAQCATPAESLAVPAIVANTWTHVVISLANPQSDSAIISVGIKMITDQTFTLWVDDIRAQKASSRVYKVLSPDLWNIVRGTTNYVKLTEAGYTSINLNSILRLSGYKIPAEITADATTCDIDPNYVIARAVGYLLGSRSGLGDMANYWMAISEKRLLQGRTSFAMNTRWI